MSYEVRIITPPWIPGPYSARATMLGVLPAVLLPGAKAVVGAAIGKALSVFGGSAAADAARRADVSALRSFYTANPAIHAAALAQGEAVKARLARAGLGMGLSRILGRAFPDSPTGVKLPRRPGLVPLPMVPATPVVTSPAPPTPIDSPRALEPAMFASAGGGGGGGIAPVATEAEADEKPTPQPPKAGGIIPVLVIGGLLFMAARRRKR